MAALSNKAYDTKADVFGLQNDVPSLKAADEDLSAEVKAALDTVDSVANQRTRVLNALVANKGDVNTLCTGLTSITNSLFNIKAEILDTDSLQDDLRRKLNKFMMSKAKTEGRHSLNNQLQVNMRREAGAHTSGKR